MEVEVTELSAFVLVIQHLGNETSKLLGMRSDARCSMETDLDSITIRILIVKMNIAMKKDGLGALDGTNPLVLFLSTDKTNNPKNARADIQKMPVLFFTVCFLQIIS